MNSARCTDRIPKDSDLAKWSQLEEPQKYPRGPALGCLENLASLLQVKTGLLVTVFQVVNALLGFNVRLVWTSPVKYNFIT